MNEIFSNLTNVGLIATIVSVIFAGASLAISYRHKAHLRAQQAAAQRPAQAAALHLPPSVQQEPPRSFFKRPASAAAPVAPPPEPATAETGATSSPLFKRLGRIGVLEDTASSPENPPDNRMDWE